MAFNEPGFDSTADLEFVVQNKIHSHNVQTQFFDKTSLIRVPSIEQIFLWMNGCDLIFNLKKGHNALTTRKRVNKAMKGGNRTEEKNHIVRVQRPTETLGHMHMYKTCPHVQKLGRAIGT